MNADGGAGAGAGAGAGGQDLTAAAAAAAAAKGAGAGDPAAGGQPKGADGTASPYAPEGLPKELLGKSERETLDNLWKAHSSLPKPPADAKDYVYTLPNDLEGYLKPEGDPVLAEFRKIAHLEHLTQKQFEGVVNAVTRAEIKAGRLEKPVAMDDIFDSLGEGGGDRAAKIEKGVQRVLAIRDQVSALTTRQQITAEHGKALTAALTDAKTVQAVEAILKLIPGEKGLTNGGQPGGNVTNIDDPAVRARLMYPNTPVRAS